MITWTDDKLVECRCNLCDHESHDVIFERQDGLRVIQCGSCGLVYVNPRPKDDFVPALYDSDYFTSSSSIGFDNYFSESKRQDMLIASRRRLLILKKIGLGGFDKALEVGCATGEFCQVVDNIGKFIVGMDVSESAIDEARSRYKEIPFHLGTIDDVNPDEKYNAVFAFEVIEHLTDPDGFFGTAYRLLEENGFLCVTTPSFECAECVGYKNWIGFSTSFEHLYFFSGDTIGKYAAKHGMHVVYTLYGGGDGLNSSKRKESKGRHFVKIVLRSLHLLDPLRKFRRSMRPIKNNYKPGEIRHNLLMILRKGRD